MSITPIPAWMKMEVLDRDGWYCLCCGQATYRYPDSKVRPNTLSFDHVLPEALGGPTNVENLQVLCMACNLHKGVDTIDLREAARAYDQAYEIAAATHKPFNPSHIGPKVWKTVTWTTPGTDLGARQEARSRELLSKRHHILYRTPNDRRDSLPLNWPMFKRRVDQIYVPNPCPVREKILTEQNILTPSRELVSAR